MLIATALLGLGSFYSEGAIALEPAPQDLSTSSNTHPTTTYPEASSTSDTERAEFIPFFEVKPALTAVKPSKVVKVLERDRLSALQTLRIPSYASTTTTTNLTNQPPQPTALGSPWSTGEDLTAAQTAERLTDAAAITMADASSISPTPSAMPSELSQAETTEEVPWRFVLEPYIYLPLETNGDVTIRNTEVPFDFSLGDILESLTFAFYGRFEAWKGPWAVVLDGYYFDTVESESRNIPAAALPPGLLPPQITQVPIDATAETAFLKLDLAGAYRFGDANLPDALSTAKTDFDLGPFVFDAIAGLRLYSFSNNIELSTPFGFERDFGRSVTFVEPMIGGRARWNFADDLAAIAAANLSGFGIGTDISVESYAGIDWLFSGNTSLTANYRLTYIDYTEGDSGLNFLQHGPAFGVKFRF
ncbi:hypothetical protein S7335_3381 [Synechococcus sp. PCC 7335]|nr:hypothetical protein S7335_3381 [Synechococcus sp. PCC 7335]